MLIDAGAAPKFNLRVSVATLDRVIFPHPQDGKPMLALERKGTVEGDYRDKARVRAQPFGGGVNGREHVGARSQADELVAIVVNGRFGVVRAPLERQHHVSFAFPPAIQQFADLAETGFELLQLGWGQLDLSAGVCDLHESDPLSITL